jgi:hypothetical protein
LISTHIIQPTNWNLPFENMCDASDHVVGAILGQRVDKNWMLFIMLAKH